MHEHGDCWGCWLRPSPVITCKQNPFSSRYSDVLLYQPLRARDTKLCT
jgi:hypothetical protein